MNEMYTIQSTRNNKFIGSLFSDGHYDTFTEREALTAYAWNSLLDCQAVANDIGQCRVVKIFLENA